MSAADNTIKLQFNLPRRVVLELALEAHAEEVTLEALLQRILYRRVKDGLQATPEAEVEEGESAVPEGCVPLRGTGGRSA